MPALHYRARIFVNRGMYREALADLDNIFSVDPEYDATDYLLRGMIKAELQDYAGAEADYATALRLDSGLVDARVAIGRLRHVQGRMAEACTVWSSAVEEGNSAAVELFGKYCQ